MPYAVDVMNSRTPRGPYRTGIKRREEIITSAVEVFGEHGFTGGYLRLIAQRVGVTPAAVLHYFGSKEGLLTAALQQWDEQSDVITGTEFEGLSFIEKQRLVVRHNSTMRGLINLYASLSTEATNRNHPAHEFFLRRYQRVFETFHYAFETAQKLGEVREDIDPGVEARALIALMDGLQIQWLIDPAVPMVEVFDACLDSTIARISAVGRHS